MEILVPIDGSECSFHALDFAIEFARRFEASLHVVHVSDSETDATDEILARARERLAEEGVTDEPEVSTDVDLAFRPADRVGEDILALVEERGYDHVVMGHHGSGAVDRMMLGSAAHTVIEEESVAVTIVP
ncbi:universal stress protein [Halorussus gelatinilyticus]|uniref:Universal stress protein n=1 Tax=Halorussus gelatinilyticus TaxID=2937524 RepID=A0A8U0INN9_9EURY|nr:universal stress protein [Halorussus gelatinilyticus]UPW01784.1 universal stress protein [Halorussus gelatinilyticus]